MLRWRNGGLALALASCGADSVPATFTMCSDDPRNNFTIDIYFNELRGQFEDYSQPIELCDQGPACISFPILISAPPRMPSPQEGRVRWQVGDFQFSIVAENGSAGTYVIEAFRPAKGQVGPVRPTPARRYSARYSARDGLMTWTSPAFGTTWSRCAGRLTFRDIEWLATQPRQSSF